MLIGRPSLRYAWIVAGLVIGAAALAQDADSDQASLLLKQGLSQYKAYNFKQAQATLLKVSEIVKANEAALEATEKKDLEEYLAKVPNAIRKQAAAMESYRSAEKALAAGRLDDAIQGFAQAATSEFLDEATRRDARAQLALAQKRKEVVAAATTPPPKPKPEPEPVATPEPAPKPEPKPAEVVTPEPAPKPEPKPAVAPMPEPAPKPEPEPAVTAAPAPKPVETATPEPAPVRQPGPEIVAPMPAAAPTAPTTPAGEPVPVIDVTPEPAPAPAPAPKPEPKPMPAPAPEPAPAVIVTAAPEPEPTPVAASPAPVAEPAQEPVAPSRTMGELQRRKAKARDMLAMGKKALDDKNADQAVRYFQMAKELDPDLHEADQLLKHAARLKSMTSAGEAGILSRLQRQKMIARQEALVSINEAVDKARDQLAAAEKVTDFNNAEQQARTAMDILQAKRSFFGATEYRNQYARIEDLLKLIAMKRDAFNKAKAASEQAEIERIQAQRRIEEQRKLKRKIETLTERAQTLRSQKQYGQALEIIDQVLLIDPDNKWAEQQREVLVEFDLLLKDVSAFRTQRVEEAKSLWDLRKAEIPWYQYLRYPKNWRQLTEMRKEVQASAAGESEADAAVREKLRREIERLSFADIDFKDVVQFLREYSDANIHVNWRALQAAGLEQSTKVSVDVRRISVKRALDLVLRDVSGAAAGADAELRYVIEGGVLTISTKADLAREPIRRVYDIRDLLVPVPDFEGPRIEMEEASQLSANGSGGGGSSGGIFEEDTGGLDEEDEITKEKLTEDFINLVKNAIDRDSWGDPQAGGVGMGFIQVLNGQLVVTQTAENHQALSELIEKLREAKTIQIMIEARFIVVDSGFLNSVGVDLDFYFNIGSNLQRANGATVVDPWTGATVPTYTPTGGTLTSNFPQTGASPWPVQTSQKSKYSPVGVKQGSAAFVSGLQTLVGSNIGLDVEDNGPALSVGGTFLDDIQVDFLIQATQAHATTRQLTAPKITLSNSQRAYITVARQQAYVREYIPVVSGNATAYRPVIDYIPTGAVLDVAATASADRRYVMMTVRPQVSNQEGDPLAILTDGGIIQLPTVSVQDLQTTVSVPDGGTLMLGGQRLAGEAEREMGAPVLSKIPVINRMFNNRATVRDERTLLILVKPKIMINEQAERNEKLYVEEPRLP